MPYTLILSSLPQKKENILFYLYLGQETFNLETKTH